MQIEMPQYEVRNSNEDRWEEISEKTFLETLADVFDPVTPILDDILHGKEIITPYGIYRLKLRSN